MRNHQENPADKYLPVVEPLLHKKGNIELDETANMIKNKLEEYQSHYRQEYFQKNAIILLGSTGAGKSTLIHFLINNNLQYLNRNGQMVLAAENGIPPFIGDKAQSETRSPSPYKYDDETYIWDTPGFLDTESMQIEIVNGISIKAIFQKIEKKIKIAFVMEVSRLKLDRGKKFIDDCIIPLMKFFRDCSKIEKNIILILTKASDEFDDKKAVINWIKDIIKNHGNMTAEQINLAKSFTEEDNILLFKKPSLDAIFQNDRRDDEKQLLNNIVYKMNPKEQFLKVINKLFFVNPGEVGQVLSQQASELLQKIGEQNYIEIFQKLNDLLTFITEQISVIESSEILKHADKINKIQNILKIVKSLNEKFPNLSITFIETTIVFEEISFQSKLRNLFKSLMIKFENLKLFSDFNSKIEIFTKQSFNLEISKTVRFLEENIQKNNEFYNQVIQDTTNFSNELLLIGNDLEKIMTMNKNQILQFKSNVSNKTGLNNLMTLLRSLKQAGLNIHLTDLETRYSEMSTPQKKTIDLELWNYYLKQHIDKLLSIKDNVAHIFPEDFEIDGLVSSLKNDLSAMKWALVNQMNMN